MKKTVDTNYMLINNEKADFTLADLAERMSRHLTACGVTASANECAHVLSAMASHRLLYIESSDTSDGGIELACAVASFLGCDAQATVCTDKTTSLTELLVGKAVNASLANKLSEFSGSGRICAVVIDNREGIDLSGILSELEGYFSADNETCEVSLGEGSLVLPKNTYFIVVLPKGKARELIGGDTFCFSCPIICEKLNTLVVNDDGKTPTFIGAEAFYGLCNEAYYRCQPSEEDWRRIDSITSFLSSRAGFDFGNDVYLTMERYFSTFTACTDNTAAAIDAFISHRVSSSGSGLTREDAEALVTLLSSIANELKLPRTALVIGSL